MPRSHSGATRRHHCKKTHKPTPCGEKHKNNNVLLTAVVEIPCIPAEIQRSHVANSLAPEI